MRGRRSRLPRPSRCGRPSRSLRRPDRSVRYGPDHTPRRGAVRCQPGCSRPDARPHPLRPTTRGRKRARPTPDVPRSSSLGRGQSRGKDNPSCTVVEMITPLGQRRTNGWLLTEGRPTFMYMDILCPFGHEMSKRKTYKIFLSLEDRIDADLEFDKDPGRRPRLARVAVTYSARLEGRWRMVVRYGNLHGN